MPNITIVSYTDAQDLLAQAPDNYAHVVSINCPDNEPPSALAAHGARRLVLHFDDIVKPTIIWTVVPSEEDVRRVIEFSNEIHEDDAVLVHCAAGISRSTAVALTIFASKEERTDEGAMAAYRKLLAARPEARPNTAIVDLADRLLCFDRALVRAHLQHLPRDADRF